MRPLHQVTVTQDTHPQALQTRGHSWWAGGILCTTGRPVQHCCCLPPACEDHGHPWTPGPGPENPAVPPNPGPLLLKTCSHFVLKYIHLSFTPSLDTWEAGTRWLCWGLGRRAGTQGRLALTGGGAPRCVPGRGGAAGLSRLRASFLSWGGWTCGLTGHLCSLPGLCSQRRKRSKKEET